MEKAFGIIPLKLAKTGWKVFLVKKKEGHVGFPKGHALKEEAPKMAAQRELFEETGLSVSNYLASQPLVETYSFEKDGRKVFKEVAYFLAEVEGDITLDGEEIAEGRWVNVHKAADQITFIQGRQLAAKVPSLLPKPEPG